MRVAVIGGAGFIGSHVVDALMERCNRVTVLDNQCRGSFRDNIVRDRPKVLERYGDCVRFVRGDIRERETVREVVECCDGVIHLAALWLLHCDKYPESAFDVNVRGAFNVFQACRDAGVPRVVFSSSASVYGQARFAPMIEATHPLDNRSFYGATKIAGEQMVRAMLPATSVSLRYMNVYGERQDHRGAYVGVLMHWLKALDAGEPIRIHGDGSQVYDFVHVSDVARANVAALESDATGEFNVGTGRGTCLRDLAGALVEAWCEAADRPGARLEFIDGPDHYVTRRVGCPDKAADRLGFRAEVELSEGLRRLVRWWRAR